MSTTVIKEIPLASKVGGKISISTLSHPYGDESLPVVSIGVSLEGNNVDWKVHIPLDNLDDVIAALQTLKQ